MTLFDLLFCYGLTFGLMNKTSWIQNRLQFTQSLLSCSYCTGFHCGWIFYLINESNKISYKEAFIYSFVSAAFCYITDCLCIYLEDKS